MDKTVISHSSMHTPRLLDAVRRVDNTARQIMERLASGLRVNTLGDDGGAQVSIDLLSADTRSMAMTLVNINAGISLGTVAQDGLDTVASLLAPWSRTRLLSSRPGSAHSGTLYRNSGFPYL